MIGESCFISIDDDPYMYKRLCTCLVPKLGSEPTNIDPSDSPRYHLIFFLKDLFLFEKPHYNREKRDRVNHMLIHSPNSYNVQKQVSLKPGTNSLFWVSHVGSGYHPYFPRLFVGSWIENGVSRLRHHPSAKAVPRWPQNISAKDQQGETGLGTHLHVWMPCG